MIKYAQLKCAVFCFPLTPKQTGKQQFPQKQIRVECKKGEELNQESSLYWSQQKMEHSDI